MSVIGLFFLTQLSFEAKLTNNKVEVTNMNQNKLTFAKVTVVLLWIQVVLVILNAAINMVGN